MNAQAELAGAPRVPLRYLVEFNPRPRPTSDESCYLPMEAISEFGAVDTSRMRPTSDLLSGYSYISDGDVAYAKVTPCFENGKGLLARDLPNGYAFATTEISVLRPRNGLDARFLAWILQSSDFRSPGMSHMTGAGGLRRVPDSFAASFRVPVPRIEVQRAIADYLDRETAQIDAFIAKNEELIALLTELRSATVARSVLRGIDPSTELRPSGVSWLGDVPAHWRVSRLSRWFSVTLGKMLDESKFASTVGEVVPYLRASNIKPERLDLTDVKSMPFTRFEQQKFSLRAGDLVVVEGGSVGVNAPIEADMPEWGFQKTVNRVRSLNGDLTKFLGYQLDVIREAGVLNMIANVSTIQHLTAEKLERLAIAMPPRSEQIAIVQHVERATTEIDEAVQRARKAIALARERRGALISAAVTGQIDVGAAA